MQYQKKSVPLEVLPTQKAHLLVIIDTEEEFDWSKGFFREKIGVLHMRSIGTFQAIFDNYGITPIYVVNYPIATQHEGYANLKKIFGKGRCIIGAHMHPWVTPPFEEIVCARNSFPGNLPAALESAKLEVLCESIEQNFGIRPNLYKAGRYGLGPNTLDILDKKGFEFDASVCPFTDFSSEEGPDFTKINATPYWHGIRKKLLELPLTVGFEGVMRRCGPCLYPGLSRKPLRRIHIPGVFARMRFLNRVVLSPEDSNINEMIRLVRTLHKDGFRIFSMAFHSPSVEPGNTPYVRSQTDLSNLLSRLTQFFDFFFGEMGGKPSTPDKVRAAAVSSHPTSDMEVQ